jgi:hypothetical protein
MSTLQRIVVVAVGAAIIGCDGWNSGVTSPGTDKPLMASGGKPVECVGTFTGVAPGNLVVPSGSFCIIIGATVGGNVQVEPGAVGFHSHNSTIEGSVHSPGPIVFDVRVLDSHVGHDVEVRRTQNGSAGAICRSDIGGNVILKDNAGFMNVGIGFPFDVCTAGNSIHGNVDIDNNSGVPPAFLGATGLIEINNNTVDQSVHVNSNTAIITILLNTIQKTLECNDNTPPPVSAGNTANNFVGQCQI